MARTMQKAAYDGSYVDTGEAVRIVVWVQMIDASTRGGFAEVEGMKTIETADGIHLNHVSKGVYRRFDNNREIRSNAPNAL
jgi:hypothetical protein